MSNTKALPEPAILLTIDLPMIKGGAVRAQPFYTADQMRAYAREALAQQPAASGEPALTYAEGWKAGYKHGAWQAEHCARPAAPQPAPARFPLTDERLNAAGLGYALADSFSSGKAEWVAQDIAHAFTAGARAAERYYAAPTAQQDPKP